MKLKKLLGVTFASLPLLLIFLVCEIQTFGSPARDHLTRQEADMVRDAQLLDKRTAIFVKAAERRLAAILNPAATSESPKDLELWGQLKGTRADFLYDLSRILDEAITNIDDVSSRDEKNPLVPKSIRMLAQVSSKVLAQLTPLSDKVDQEKERSPLEQSLENASAIVEAAGKLPPPTKSTKKKDTD